METYAARQELDRDLSWVYPLVEDRDCELLVCLIELVSMRRERDSLPSLHASVP